MELYIKQLVQSEKIGICWLDRLLCDGFRVPKELDLPLTILITGPPGAGKSLLLQQICYSRALLASNKPGSIIFQLEATPEAIIANLKSLQWQDRLGGRFILGVSASQSPPPILAISRIVLENKARGKGLVAHKRVAEFVEQLGRTVEARCNSQAGADLGIIGIDGLNSLFKAENQALVVDAVLHRLRQTDAGRVPLLIMVSDTEDAYRDPRMGALEYMADLVIKVETVNQDPHRYFDRYIEIAKARFQKHIKGRHLLKIVPLAKSDCWKNTDRHGPRPVLREGGVYIFPSAHFVLGSQRGENYFFDSTRSLRFRKLDDDKKQAQAAEIVAMNEIHEVPGLWSEVSDVPGDHPADDPTYGPPNWKGLDVSRLHRDREKANLPWPVPFLRTVTNCGMSLAKPTVLIGCEDLATTIFCVRFIRDGLCGPPTSDDKEGCLVLSFGEVDDHDFKMRVHTQVNFFLESLGAIEPRLAADAVVRDRLTVITQKPGMVTADELLHRITYWIAKQDTCRVLVRGIDEFSTLYPRLSANPMFFPALIDVLDTHRITSLFSASKRSASNLGLMALASAVIESRGSYSSDTARYLIELDVERVGRKGVSPVTTPPIEFERRTAVWAFRAKPRATSAAASQRGDYP